MFWGEVLQAKEGLDEYVVDQFNTQEKVGLAQLALSAFQFPLRRQLPTLIFDLILIEVSDSVTGDCSARKPTTLIHAQRNQPKASHASLKRCQSKVRNSPHPRVGQGNQPNLIRFKACGPDESNKTTWIWGLEGANLALGQGTDNAKHGWGFHRFTKPF